MQARSQQLTSLQQVKDDMFGEAGESTMGLSGADLEEEALLILVRRYNDRAGDVGSGQNSSTNRNNKNSPSTSVSTNTANFLAQLEQFELESSSEENDEDDDDGDGDEENIKTSDAKSGLHDPGPNEVAFSQQDMDNPEMIGMAGAGTGKKRKIQVNVVIKTVKLWASNVTKTLEAVIDAHRRNTEQGITNDGEVSIVLSKPIEGTGSGSSAVETLFVRWHNPDEFEGRAVRIDQHHRVVWSPSTLFGKPIPTRVFACSSFDILVTAAGAKCLKIAGTGRDTLPSTMVRFVQFVNVLGISWNEDAGTGPNSKGGSRGWLKTFFIESNLTKPKR